MPALLGYQFKRYWYLQKLRQNKEFQKATERSYRDQEYKKDNQPYEKTDSKNREVRQYGAAVETIIPAAAFI